jgi:CheY-like chemotaxis protein
MQKQALIVDDSRVARMSLSKILSSHDVDITEAVSAEEAIRYLEVSERQPDIIFMDVMMDGMDGLTATKKIKANPKFSPIPIVICTGNQTELDNENALAAGAVSVLTKPAQADLISDIMTALTQQAVALPKQQSVVVKVDKATMTAKVVEIIEQKLLPKLSQQVQEIASETIDKATLANQAQLKNEIDTILPSLEQQLVATITEESLIALRPMLEQQVNEAISTHAEQAIQSMTANLDLSTQASDALARQAQPWLAKQERQLQVELGMQIGPKVMSAVDQHLDSSLAAMIAPLVTLQVEKHLADQQAPRELEVDDSEETLEKMAKRVGQLNAVVIGLAATVVVLAVFVLI